MLIKSLKKGISLLLVIVLIFSLLSLEVFADDVESQVDNPTFQTLDQELEEENEEESSLELEENEKIAPISKPSDSRVTIINSSPLNAKSPKSEELDEYLDSVMAEIINDDMTTYEKTKACYDYIVKNTRYGSHTSKLSTPVGDVTCGQIYSQYGAVEGFGAVALTAQVGMCNAYASAFILMANEIGLDAYLVKGYTRGRGGSYVYHEWAEVNIDGTTYAFDPQLEQNLTAAGLGVDNVFCKTYSQLSGRYSKK